MVWILNLFKVFICKITQKIKSAFRNFVAFCLFQLPEMRPKWFQESDIPFESMWPDDHYWFPLLLTRQKFKAFFLFKGMDVILKHWIKTVEDEIS